MIDINNLTLTLDNKKILENINLKIKEGKIYGLIGPNGVGKTSLIKCLTGIYEVTEGELLYDGFNVYNSPEVKSKIAYVADENNFFTSFMVKDIMKYLIVYFHGKGGLAEEAEYYKTLFPNSEVIGFDYQSQTPWEARKEFSAFFTEQRSQCEHLTLVANSIGAFFALSSLNETLVDGAYLISPVVNMENLICNMMQWSNVTEQELAEKRKIATNFGETLSWKYLCYVRQHPIIWNVPTCILYGEHDNLTSLETVSVFAKQHHAELTIMPGGEHWFHTEEQMQFLNHWIRECRSKHACCRSYKIIN